MQGNKAPLLSRFLASSLDGLLYLDLFLFMLYRISISGNQDGLLNSVLDAIIILLVLNLTINLVQVYLTSKVGGSLGKIINGLEVIGRGDGKLITFKRAIFRRIVKLLLSAKVLWIGYLWIIIHHENLSWHDMAANTKVVSRSKNGWMVGLLIAIILLVVGVVLVQMSVQGFIDNSHVYTNLILDVKNSL